jgi:hypothetical protein
VQGIPDGIATGVEQQFASARMGNAGAAFQLPHHPVAKRDRQASVEINPGIFAEIPDVPLTLRTRWRNRQQ